jgi:1-acyl-sn-glycerol-3-phosphate acyltransferase
LKLHYRFFNITIRFLARNFFGWKVIGGHNIPAAGALIAANHISVCDPPLLGSAIKRNVYYFAKQELFRNRLVGLFLKSVNAFPARRGAADRQAWKTAKRVLTSGKLLLFFPEGTRSADGQLRPAQPGMARLAISAGVPVVPAAVVGSNRLRDVFLRRAKLRIGFGRPVPTLAFEDRDGRSRYDRLTECVMTEIGRLIVKVQQV